MLKLDSTYSRIEKAFNLIREGRDADAAREFEDMLLLTDERTVIREICIQLGQCYVTMNEYDKAEEALRKAEKNCESNDVAQLTDIYKILLSIFSEEKNKEGIVYTCECILKNKQIEKKTRLDAAKKLATLYLNEKEFNEGLKITEDAINEFGDDDKILLYIRIKLYSMLKQGGQALDFGLDYIERFGFNEGVYNILGEVYGSFSMTDKSFRYFKDVYETLSDEQKMEKFMSSNAFVLTTSMLAGSLYHEEMDKEFYLKIINERYEITKYIEKNTLFNNDYGFFKRLRIGYLSADLKAHPVGEFVSPVIINRNSCHSDNICYSTVKHEVVDNPITNYLKEFSAEWHDLYEKSDNEIEEYVLEDAPDIILELASLTADNLLGVFARRLAPLQVSWIGFPVSTGIKAIDYVIGDKYVDPPGIAEEYYTEKLLYLPDTFLCQISTYDVDVAGIPYDKNGYITFGCFNNSSKIKDRMLKNWNRILEQVEGSRLLLKSNSFKQAKTLDMLKDRMEKIGMDFARIDFETSSDFMGYLEKYNEVDIVLDTYPFNGATTTHDAFMMGVPLVALTGERHVSRVSFGMLSNVGLEDLAVYTDDDYVSKAVELAEDVDRLREIKSTLRDIKLKSKLSDVDSFRAEYEFAMRHIWIDYCKKNRKYPVYGGLSLEELSDSLVNGAYYMRKLIEDTGAVSDVALFDEYINLQRVFARKLVKAWSNDPEKAKPLKIGQLLSKNIFLLKDMEKHDMDEMLLANIRFIKHYSLCRTNKEIDRHNTVLLKRGGDE